MDWPEIIAIMFGNAAWVLPMFLWIRSEANSDRREMVNLIINFKDEVQKEMKDFHGKLCQLEEKYKQIKQ